ncbi:MAG: hypothetical protein ABSH52_17880 [Terriglobia bacterium]|jgi:hypothetical protein
MDIKYFFGKKLEVLREFYATGKVPFDQAMDDAEVEYDQWSSSFAGEDEDPSPPKEVMDRYEKGSACKSLLGQACLSALQQTLKEYLKEFISDRGQWREAERLISELRKRGFGELQCYKTVFRELLGCDWDKGPIPFSILKEIVLARNAVQHEGHISSLDRWRDRQYKSKYPVSLFANEAFPTLISVTEDNLRLAMGSIERFVEWLEATRG